MCIERKNIKHISDSTKNRTDNRKNRNLTWGIYIVAAAILMIFVPVNNVAGTGNQQPDNIPGLTNVPNYINWILMSNFDPNTQHTISQTIDVRGRKTNTPTPRPRPRPKPTHTPHTQTPISIQTPIISIQTLNKEVQGYYPMDQITASTDYKQINYSLISTIVYGYIIVNGDGSLTKLGGSGGYDPEPVVSYAHSKGVKVTLQIIASINDLDNLLSSSTAMDTAVNNLLNEVQNQSGYTFDGIDTNFENFNYIYKNGLTTFQNKLSTKFWANTPKWTGVSRYHMTMAIPMDSSINSNTGRYDLNSLQNYADYVMAMGYDWYGNWEYCSTTNNAPCAGPNAPVADNNPVWPNGIVNRIHYIETLMNKNKLLLGIPWYGYLYKAISNIRFGQLSDSNYLLTINYGNYVNQYTNPIFDPIWETPWYAYQDNKGQWWQAHFDNLQSLGIKYDFVNSEGLPGIGIWNLLASINSSTDVTSPDLWNLIDRKFK